MTVELDHPIVEARDKRAAAAFLATLLEETPAQHLALIVSEDEFDAVVARIRRAGLTDYADPRTPAARPDRPARRRSRHLLRRPDGHDLEILTRPYGST